MPTAERVRDLIRAYADGPRLLDAALAGIPPDEVRFTPGPEHWSIHENVIHLADTDIAGAARIRYLLAEPEATLVSFHGTRWARVLDYGSQSLDDALAVFRAVRGATAGLLSHLRVAAWEAQGANWKRVETDSEPKTLTLPDLVQQGADHVHYHLRIIAKRRAQYAQRGGEA